MITWVSNRRSQPRATNDESILIKRLRCKEESWKTWRCEPQVFSRSESAFASLFSSVQSLSHVWLFMTPWTAALKASLSITNSQSPPKPMSIESVMPSNHLILCHPLPFLPSIFPSIKVFSNESALYIRWPKVLEFQLQHQWKAVPFIEQPGMISSRMDWLGLLAVQGTLKSLLQHHSSKASVLWHSAFFIVQLSHPYMTTGKAIALTRWTFFGKVMSLLFNMLLCKLCFFPVVMYRCDSWTIKKPESQRIDGAGEDSWKSHGQKRDQTSQS